MSGLLTFFNEKSQLTHFSKYGKSYFKFNSTAIVSIMSFTFTIQWKLILIIIRRAVFMKINEKSIFVYTSVFHCKDLGGV